MHSHSWCPTPARGGPASTSPRCSGVSSVSQHRRHGRRRASVPAAGPVILCRHTQQRLWPCHALPVQQPSALGPTLGSDTEGIAEQLDGRTWTLTPPKSDIMHFDPSHLPSVPDSKQHAAQEHTATAQATSDSEGDTPSRLSRLEALRASAKKDRSLSVQSVQWYPGHIARAERQLKEQLKMVDVVLEVRDARIPVSTHHPQVAKWIGDKQRLLIINRQDQVSVTDRRAWAEYYKDMGQRVYWTHGKQGDGVKGVRTVLDTVSETINKKRAGRGLAPRPVRACVIGFPNIGKSALINRLIGRRAVASAAKPGVTRALQWVRLSGQLDLLDAPGIIPAAFNDQVAAQRLAVCNDIGEAAYVDSAIAAALIVRCKLLPKALKLMDVIRERYGVDPEESNSETFLQHVADRMFLGDTEKAGARILKDYRTGALGSFALELPDDIEDAAMRSAREQAERAKPVVKRSDGF